jgi:hypothetical protein
MVGEFELSKKNIGIVFIDSILLPCIDDDEWLNTPSVCGDGRHEGGRGVYVFFALDVYLQKSVMAICKFNEFEGEGSKGV